MEPKYGANMPNLGNIPAIFSPLIYSILYPCEL